jgi:hypothetical protein
MANLSRVLLSAVLISLATLLLFTPAAAYEANGSTWDTYEVCYRIEPEAAAYSSWIHQAAQAWTAASENGFAFVHDQNCQSGVWRTGIIDGWGINYGFTILNGEYAGPAGPPHPIEIIRAETTIEEYPGNPIGQFCPPCGPVTWDPLGCPAVPPDAQTCCGPTAAGCPSCTILVDIGGVLHWPSPTVQAVTLHEFGHWLWLGENWLQWNTAMAPVLPCESKSLAPDDIAGLNWLYP